MDKEERKKIILEKALLLFLEKGFEDTSIQNIIDALKMSKGGFYHHYKSKDELLDDLAIRRAEDYIRMWESLKKRDDLTGREKFIEVFRISNDFKARNLHQTLAAWKVLYRENNLRFRIKILEKQIERAAPEISPYIIQAVEEGDFNTPYPEESVALILRYSDKMMETILPLLLRAEEDTSIIPEIYKHYNFLFFIIERILGAKEGSLPIFPPGYLEDIFQ